MYKHVAESFLQMLVSVGAIRLKLFLGGRGVSLFFVWTFLTFFSGLIEFCQIFEGVIVGFGGMSPSRTPS